jgi:phosphoenolpyruvate carboxykinase (ATP)
MRDQCIPPVMKINDPHLAASFGATLTSQRTAAEHLSVNPNNNIVIEPYANPFRTYPLSYDYNKFRALFGKGINCYILNTSNFFGKAIPPDTSLMLLENIIKGNNKNFKKLFNLENVGYILPEGFERPDTHVWRHRLIENMFFRLSFINNQTYRDKLPGKAADSIKELICKLRKFRDN